MTSTTTFAADNRYDFSSKVALVTGSSDGMGAAIAIQLAQYKASLTITGRNGDKLRAIAEKVKKLSGKEPLQIIGDLQSDPALPERLVKQTVDKFGRLDFLVNCAFAGDAGDNFKNPDLVRVFDGAMVLGVRVPLELTQLASDHLAKTKGAVVNISGITSKVPMLPIGSITKAAVDMVTKTTAQALAPSGVRVNAILPGAVVTSMGRMFGSESFFRDNAAHIAQAVPLKRVAQPSEIANLAVFLLSPEAVNMTGSLIVTDGGALIDAKIPL